ncbi:hypothetical protein GCM10011309_18220 [Litorimonas cladophorae]|uniref:Antibiotic biosynthesis monooxygenase n=1 Tax=Litorimonas cladophorae TaxID=1220491 RepID=A0A918KPV2_9PROT|nr:hypothetical protein GCM10011309_18220 [Litorimonas cladophorae]
MYCVSYRFELLSNNSETRRQFIDVWSGFTAFFRDECGALGSRLHYGEDGAFYAYAQWPSHGVMEAAQDVTPSQNFLKLRLKWAELCGPSEVLWQGETMADLLLPAQ